MGVHLPNIQPGSTVACPDYPGVRLSGDNDGSDRDNGGSRIKRVRVLVGCVPWSKSFVLLMFSYFWQFKNEDNLFLHFPSAK